MNEESIGNEGLNEVKEVVITLSLPNVGPSRHSVLSPRGKGGYRNVNNVDKYNVNMKIGYNVCRSKQEQKATANQNQLDRA